MVYRINIGGERLIYPDQDNGMSRNWDGSGNDSSNSSILLRNSIIHLNFSKIPEYRVTILNGLEMFKLSANWNLAGPSPDPPPIAPAKGTPSKPSTRSRTPLLATVVGVACGILGLSVLGFLVFRRRRRVKGTASNRS
ncbi:receptor-like protein kinase FERONIA [Pyrus ussuriensis x Pyrus communis]|uniref:Receptor-like protein kinase FERONIA n=1 Tax=Pyrus ussuriensis x Pyrus communis TaxID=2448454 RepID=A0A5N5G9L4_9ROSA|nr:receptor-like protein kinase FERONIA [Pyrus ussuriensis x Pyrus communis]